MANNTKIPFVQLSDTINTHRKRFNQLVDSVGDITSLTTDAVDVVQSINELDAKLDSIQNTGLWTPGAHFSDSNFVSHFDGQLNVDTRIWTSNLEADSAYVGQLNASQVDIDSAYVDVLDVHFLHADSAYIDGDLSVKGNLIVDGVSSLKAGNASLVTIGDTNTDAVVFQAQVGSAIIPNNKHDLGGQTDKWGTLWVENASIDSAAINQLDVDSADIRQLRLRDGIIDSAYVTQLNVATMDADNVVLDSAYIGQLNVSQADIDSAYADQINVNKLDVDSAYVVQLSASQVNVDSAYFSQINVSQIAGDSAYFSQLNFKDVDVDSAFMHQLNVLQADIDSAHISQLDVDSADIRQLRLRDGIIDSAYVTQLNVATMDVDNATLDSAYIGQLNSANADIDSAHISQLHVDSADFGTLSTSGFIGIIDSAAASNLHVNTLSVNSLVAATQVVEGNVRTSDAYVVLLSENTPDQGQPTQNAGIAVRRRSYDSAVIEWNENGNYWVANYDSSNTSQILTASNIDGSTLEFSSGTVNVKDNGIALGTKTTGNYVQSVGVTASTGISASGTGEGATVTIAGVNATTSVKGVASFSSDNFSVSNGAVSVKNNGITLGTETTGNYMSGISGTTNEITVSHTPGEGSSATIGLPDDVTITDQLSVNRIAVSKGITADSADISQFAADSANVSGNLWVGGNTILKGNLTVSGTTTTVNTETINLADNIIVLNSNLGSSIAPTQDGGIEIERGNRNNAKLVWDESENYWAVHDDSAATKTDTLSRIATSSWLDATAPISFNSTFGSITHDNATRTDTTSEATASYSGEQEVIDSITTNATGHVTAVNTKTITWPAAVTPNNSTITISARHGLKTGGNFTLDQSFNETISIDIDSSDLEGRYRIPLLNSDPSTGTFWYDGLNSVNNSSGVSKMIIGNSSYDWNDNGSPTLELRQYGYSSSVGGGGLTAELLGMHKVNFTYKQQNTASGGDDTAVDVVMADITTDIEHTSSSKVQRGALNLAAYTTTSTNGATNETAKLVLGSGATYNDATLSADNNVVLDAAGDITLDADGNNINFTNGSGADTWIWTLNNDATGSFVSPDYFTLEGVGGLELKSSYLFGGDNNLKLTSYASIYADGNSFVITGDSDLQYLRFYGFDGVNNAQEIQATDGLNIYANEEIEIKTGQSINDKAGGHGGNIVIESESSNPAVGTDGYVIIDGENGVWLEADNGSIIMSRGSAYQTTQGITYSIGTAEQTMYATNTLTINSGNYTSIQANQAVLLEPDNGKVYFQTTAQQGFLDFATTSTIKLYTGTYSGTLNSTWSGDDLTVQGDVTSISDIRTKENIETINGGVDLVSQLRGVWYNKIGEEERKVGVVAQEVEEVLPEVVKTDEEGMKSVDYGKMVGVLIEAIKDLKSEVDMLKLKLGE